MNLSPKDIFIIACIGHLETISSPSYVALPDADYFITKCDYIKQSHLLVLPPTSSEKSFLSIGKLSSSWHRILVFQKANICLKA